MPHYPRLNFKWVAGQSVSQQELDEAFERMRDNFPKPHKKPPEAWFNTMNVKYYDASDFTNWTSAEQSLFLEDLSSGLQIFGRLKIWVDWFHHLLPSIIKNIHRESVYRHFF